MLLLSSSPHLWLPVEPGDWCWHYLQSDFLIFWPHWWWLLLTALIVTFGFMPSKLSQSHATVSKHTKYTFPNTKHTFPTTKRLLEIPNPPSQLSVLSFSPTASSGSYTIHPPVVLVAMMFVRIWNNLFMLDHHHNDDYEDCWIWALLADYEHDDFKTHPSIGLTHSHSIFGWNIFNDDCEDFDRFWFGSFRRTKNGILTATGSRF